MWKWEEWKKIKCAGDVYIIVPQLKVNIPLNK